MSDQVSVNKEKFSLTTDFKKASTDNNGDASKSNVIFNFETDYPYTSVVDMKELHGYGYVALLRCIENVYPSEHPCHWFLYHFDDRGIFISSQSLLGNETTSRLFINVYKLKFSLGMFIEIDSSSPSDSKIFMVTKQECLLLDSTLSVEENIKRLKKEE